MEAVSTGLIEWAVAEQVLPGQTESGDRYLVTPTQDGWLVAVVDGLGHGAEAAEAAKAAVRSLERHAGEPIIPLVRDCHGSLFGTRGVVMSVAAFHVRDETLTWIGVGNVEGVLLRAQATAGPRRESLLLRGGVVGGHLPALVAAILPVTRGDALIFATDGVRSDFAIELHAQSDAPQQLADRVLRGWGTKQDDALVLVARYLGPAR
jgi:negative regulator of sigma-B (phosphoserine phosphatase)